MRIPTNIIETNYTSGNEFVYLINYKFYQGYYYELNDKFFAGKEFNANAPELIKADSREINPLLTNPNTFTYGFLSKVRLNNSKPSSFIYRYEDNVRYFIYSITNKIIREVNKKTYNDFINNPYYVSVALSYEAEFNEFELNEAEKKIPGIKTFVNTSYLRPPFEEDGSVG